MPFYKFKDSDLLYNRIKTKPNVKLSIYKSQVYYKNLDQSLVNSNTPSGHINLHELNVNRSTDLAYAFLPKGSDLSSFRTVSSTDFFKGVVGDELKFTYPLTSSIQREYHATGSDRPRVDALRNVMNFYTPLSKYYSFDDSPEGISKSHQELNLITIPSIFYGSSIDKGSITLDYYITGTLIGRLQDVNKNGELIQVLPTGSVGSGSTAGVVLYNEGFILLTGSWDLSDGAHTIDYGNGAVASSWLYYGVGANDGVSAVDDDSSAPGIGLTSRVSASYDMEFDGINYVPTLTMLAHANKGELNNSDNYTFIQSGSYPALSGSETHYKENDEIPIKNIVSSSYNGYKEDFERQTYISRVGIYDKNKNLIATAKLATPVKKTNKRDFTFKLKLDF
jgi:hypothetical protein